MSTTTDLTPAIATGAARPQTATVDGLTATLRPLSDVIAADEYLRNIGTLAPQVQSQGVAPTGWAFTRPAKAIPPGAV